MSEDHTSWCVQSRPTGLWEVREDVVQDLPTYLLSLDGELLVRYTHMSSAYIDRFRNSGPDDRSPENNTPYREFGWVSIAPLRSPL